jgi:DNA-binding transcriptional regulator YiaG
MEGTQMATRIPTKRAAANGTNGSKAPRIPKNLIEKHKKQIPERLAKIRATRSQRSFARELGVFQQNVNRYENGTTPHADFLITLAVQEGISLDWLLLGRGQPRHRNESRR